MTLLWVVEFEYSTRLHHGAVMRFVNYARELQAAGHRVFFAALIEEQDPGPTRLWFRDLMEQGIIEGFFELEYTPSQRALRLASRLIHPALGNLVLRRDRQGVVSAIQAILQEHHVDAVITSKRRMFFLAQALEHPRHRIIDFCDCEALYYSRDVKSGVRDRRWGKALRQIPALFRTAVVERYYARHCSAAIVVSPVDKQALDRLSGMPKKSHILLNGVVLPPRSIVPKIPNRLIFSGNMNFPPNQSAALWFAAHVLPAVRKEIPGAHLVLAGANPSAELRAFESEAIHVTGFVEDMNRELAASALYVAPLSSGGGFKNKVIEALANSTYVVATPMAVEFLAPEVRSRVAVASSPEEMTAAVLRILRNPAVCQENLEFLYRYVCANMTWAGQTGKLLSIIDGAGRS